MKDMAQAIEMSGERFANPSQYACIFRPTPADFGGNGP
jgi:hypothetical protein